MTSARRAGRACKVVRLEYMGRSHTREVAKLVAEAFGVLDLTGYARRVLADARLELSASVALRRRARRMAVAS